MTVFLTELRPGPLVGMCCVIGLALAVNPLASQETIERNSDLPSLEKKSNAPIQLVPSVDTRLKLEIKVDPTKIKNEAAVELKQLELVDPESTGILDASDGGFKPGMWAGSSRPLIINLLGLLPKKITSPGQRQLFRRLLLTRAEPPVGEQKNKSLLLIRVAALYEAGDFVSANKLIDAIPSDELNEKLSKIQAEIFFRQQDPKKACAIVQSREEGFNAIYWKKAEAYCLAIEGQNEKALLVSEILSEQNRSVDPAFIAGIEALTGNKPDALKRINSLSGLLLSMLQAGKVALPESLPSNLSTGDYAALAFSENRSLTKRVLDGETAMLGGAISPIQLVQLYKIRIPDIGGPDGAISRVVEDREIKWNPENRSFLLQAVLAEARPAKKAKIIERAFKYARLHNSFALAALAMTPAMDEIEPSTELSWFAPWAVRAYAVGGNMIAAKNWLSLQTKGSDVSFLPLNILTGASERGSISEKELRQWYLSEKKVSKEGFEDRVRFFYSLLQALDISVAGSLWSDVVNGESTEKPLPVISGLLSLLSDAAQKGRVGETVALSIILLGDAGTERSNQFSVVQAVRSLYTLGQREAARQLALEAAVAAGL
ncbi:MAG: hypothetical protein VX696_03760 [Pseudomonadota bacterium]|nr:hypothetical protein [Pseudomonadota bacterium]